MKKINETYTQLDKNTVLATNQLKETENVKFDLLNAGGIKITFVGNSMTLHGVLEEIGWNFEHGMAASKKENDYVHILKRKVLNVDPLASFCICQVANWEWEYKNGTKTHYRYKQAQNFNADVIIIRCIENCPKKDFDSQIFIKELDALISYLDQNKKAKVIITTGFWRHPGDDALREYAQKNSFPCVVLNDLGELDEMKAIGLFSHGGVANHPGDKGMKEMANRIAVPLLQIVKQFKK
ncbi:MAG: SGNH/GDSL hydrolase family protein [Clostridia bacterium]|nr:SGNH/GDSL hydrolase family protein [Clostridia bacterium]